MAALIYFKAGSGDVNSAGAEFAGPNVSASGLGFYGASFGQSVQVNYWQDSTFICDTGGTLQGPKANNAKYTDDNAWSGEINGAVTKPINTLPNASGTVNLRFTFDSDVKTQNAKLYIYDRTTKTAHASGVWTAVAELVHPWSAMSVSASSTAWTVMSGQVTGNYVSLVASPCESGLTPGASVADDKHDWYLLLSACPRSIGSKDKFGMFFELEYV